MPRFSVDLGAQSAAPDSALLPPGFLKKHAETALVSRPTTGRGHVFRQDQNPEERKKMFRASAMNIAWSPGKSLLYFAFMMFMTGSQLSVWSIFILIPILMTPVQQLLNIDAAFEPVADSGIDLSQPKMLYIALSIVGLAMGAWKFHTLGLLPVTSADWVSLLSPLSAVEHSAAALPLL